MNNEIFDYSYLLSQVKRRVALAQQRAIYAANEEMLHMYWDIGELLEKSQMADGWGKKTLERLSVDLKNEYPKVKGFSVQGTSGTGTCFTLDADSRFPEGEHKNRSNIWYGGTE